MFWNALLLALRTIRRNLLRSSLTILGIVIGVAAVITMVTLGNGATAQVTADITKMGSNLLMARPGQWRGPGGSSQSAQPFDLKDVEAIQRECPSLAAVAPCSNNSAQALFGNSNRSTSVTGTTNAYLLTKDWDLAQGRDFSANELQAGKAVCILGRTVQTQLFGSQDPLGQTIRIRRTAFTVIGTLAPKGQTGMGRDQDDIILVPLKTAQRRLAGNQDVGLILISAAPGADTAKACDDVRMVLRERRRIASTEDDDFEVQDMQEIASTLTATTRVLTALLGAVAAVSLLVGGIGIMNIMLVSVTERTREIGTRLAIGALQREVLLQFLVEAVVLAAFGGLLGILLALGASLGLTRLMQVPFTFDTGIMGVAFLFSAGVGIVFGYFPARRAAALDPIEALRHE